MESCVPSAGDGLLVTPLDSPVFSRRGLMGYKDTVH